MPKQKWFKGNLHTHTTESDGDADPKWVANCYKEHGYDFLVLSDHNHRTILDQEIDGLLMVPGEEITAQIKMGSIPIHINGIGVSRVVEPTDGTDIVATIQANVNSIRDAGGIVTTWKNDDAKKAGNIICSANKILHNKILKILKPVSK